MLFGDKSPRTKRVSNSAKIIIAAIILILVCTVGVIIGHLKFKDVVNKSSTPIGTSLTFPRSNTDVVLKKLYVDKNNDVMIVRLAAQNGSDLPYRGTDYKVYLNSKSLQGHKKADILFGRMSTDGDLFLVIPKPKNEVYSVFIMNKKYLGSSDPGQTDDVYVSSDNENLTKSTGVTNKNEADDSQTQQSISKALSGYQFSQDNPEESTTYNNKVGSDYDDIISFRVTKDPAFKDKKYKPTRLNVDLLNNKNQFDYEKFFDVAFKDAIVKDLENKYTDLDTQLDNYKDRQKEVESRLNDNPDDSDAKDNLEKIKSSIESLKQQQDDISNQITEYSLLQYNDSYFKYMNKSATIVDK